MKYILTVAFIFLLNVAHANDKQQANEVKQVLKEILTLCADEAKEHELANLIVYRGKDEARNWKDVCNYSDTDERMRVRLTRLKIQKQLLPYQYEFIDFQTELKSSGRQYIWTLQFERDGEKKKMSFAFLKINDAYALGEIDG